MRKPILNSFIALAVLTSTFGAVAVYKTSDHSGRSIASVENPIVAEYASASFIREQKIRMEEVTIEMKNANGEMIKVTKRIVEIETRIAAQMKKGVAYSNIAEITKLKNDLASVNAAKAKVETTMSSLKVKHQKALDDLTSTNKALSNLVTKKKAETVALKSKIAELERTGLVSTEEIAKLKSSLSAKELENGKLTKSLVDLRAQVNIKNTALAQSIMKGNKLETSVQKLNIQLEKLNLTMENKDQEFQTLSEAKIALQENHDNLVTEKENLDIQIGKLISETEAKSKLLSDKESEIKENQNLISCQKEEIKVNTDKIAELKALVEKSTKAISDSAKAIKSFKVEKEERVEKITKLEKENKKFKTEQKEFGSVMQMMMSQFMMMPQMMQPRMARPQITNPLAGFSMSDMFMMKMMQGGGSNGFGSTGFPMFDPYAAPKVVTNNYFAQKNPYGGELNDFNVREMYQPSNRAPSGYFTF